MRKFLRVRLTLIFANASDFTFLEYSHGLVAEFCAQQAIAKAAMTEHIPLKRHDLLGKQMFVGRNRVEVAKQGFAQSLETLPIFIRQKIGVIDILQKASRRLYIKGFSATIRHGPLRSVFSCIGAISYHKIDYSFTSYCALVYAYPQIQLGQRCSR
ncbi:hypothetical protein MGEO_19150 [Marivita geojedonensis]|uniref:Uncharacterized protein n=1 Tax=Marivita geojedonensis TaxID=1123756 RepID=A0A1X4NC77_9RHOB|nr:hypothetical protein MGEO_19150 [Marivita geojedonensis]